MIGMYQQCKTGRGSGTCKQCLGGGMYLEQVVSRKVISLLKWFAP